MKRNFLIALFAIVIPSALAHIFVLVISVNFLHHHGTVKDTLTTVFNRTRIGNISYAIHRVLPKPDNLKFNLPGSISTFSLQER